MDGQYSWKRTDEIEIDLADLLRKLCGQWKRIAVCALASAVLLGGYGWMKGRNVPEAAILETPVETVLTEEEEQKVEDAVWLEQEIRDLETYLDDSVLMQIDPYHKNKVIMLYHADAAKRQELPVITESYLNFALNGGAAEALLKSGDWEMDKSCLAELISAYQKTYSGLYQTVIDSQTDSGEMPGSLFYVEITGRDARTARKMALDMQEVLKKYSAKVKKEAGSHRLTLVSSTESIAADGVLQSQQHDKKTLLSANRTNLKMMTDAFSKEQMAVYHTAIGVENEAEQDDTENMVSSGSSRPDIRYIFLGLAGGVFAYCSIFACWYLFSDKVKGMEEMRRLYKIPFYGGMIPADRKQKKGSVRSGVWQESFHNGTAQILNRIRLDCKKRGINRLCAASDFPLGVQEKKCLENIALQLKSWEIDLAVAENASTDTAVWDGMAETGNVLMVCRMGLTTHRMIDEVMNFYMENGIAVIGAVAFSQNG